MPYIFYYRLAWDAFKLSCASFYSHVLKIQPWVVDMPGNVWISTWIYNKVPFCLSGCTGWICKDWPAAGSERKNGKNKERKTLLYTQTSVCAPQKHMQLELCSQTLYLTHRNAKRQEDKKQPACENTIREPGVWVRARERVYSAVSGISNFLSWPFLSFSFCVWAW